MKNISTLNARISHDRKPEFDDARIAAIDEMIEELCPLEEVAEALIDTLRKVNPDVRDVVAENHVVILEIGVNIREVDIQNYTFADLYTSLVAECLR